MSFDAKGKTFTLALKSSISLLLFRLDSAPIVTDPDKPPPELTPEIIKHAKPVIDWTYSFDGDSLISATEDQVWRYDVKTGDVLETSHNPLIGRTGGSLITAVAASCGGKYLAVGYEDGEVMIHDLRHPSPSVLRLGHEGSIAKLGFSPDRRVLAVLVKSRESNKPWGFIRLWVTEKWERDEDK